MSRPLGWSLGLNFIIIFPPTSLKSNLTNFGYFPKMLTFQDKGGQLLVGTLCVEYDIPSTPHKYINKYVSIV